MTPAEIEAVVREAEKNDRRVKLTAADGFTYEGEVVWDDEDEVWPLGVIDHVGAPRIGASPRLSDATTWLCARRIGALPRLHVVRAEVLP